MGVIDETIADFLSELHPVQIVEHIIKPSIQEIIDDYQDALDNVFYDEKTEADQIEMTKDMIGFWKEILTRIDNEG